MLYCLLTLLGLCNNRASVCPIDRQQQRPTAGGHRRSAANAGSATLTADKGGWRRLVLLREPRPQRKAFSNGLASLRLSASCPAQNEGYGYCRTLIRENRTPEVRPTGHPQCCHSWVFSTRSGFFWCRLGFWVFLSVTWVFFHSVAHQSARIAVCCCILCIERSFVVIRL